MKSLRRRIRLACVTSIVGAATAVAAAAETPAVATPTPTPPPAAQATDPKTGNVDVAGLRLPDLEGNTVSLASYLGKGPVVLDFWATWCKPCLAALPELNTLYTDLAPRGLQLVGINEDGQRNASKVKPFVVTQGFKFPVLLDLNRDVQSRLNIAVLPTTLLLDRDGKLVHTSFGYRPGETAALRQQIEALLDAKADH